jgi:hypothetical protein
MARMPGIRAMSIRGISGASAAVYDSRVMLENMLEAFIRKHQPTVDCDELLSKVRGQVETFEYFFLRADITFMFNYCWNGGTYMPGGHVLTKEEIAECTDDFYVCA